MDATRRALFGAGAGLGALSFVPAQARPFTRGGAYLDGSGLVFAAPQRHWPVSAEVERRLSQEIEGRAEELRALTHASLIAHAQGAPGEGRFFQYVALPDALIEHQLRQGYIETSSDAQTFDGKLWSYGYRYTDFAGAEGRRLMETPLQTLPAHIKAELGRVADAYRERGWTYARGPEADAPQWRWVYESLDQEHALGAAEAGLLGSSHWAYGRNESGELVSRAILTEYGYHFVTARGWANA